MLVARPNRDGAKIEELIHELKGPLHDRRGHPQHAAGRARVRLHRVLLCVGELVEYDLADNLFTKPSDPRTEDYITGRFG